METESESDITSQGSVYLPDDDDMSSHHEGSSTKTESVPLYLKLHYLPCLPSVKNVEVLQVLSSTHTGHSFTLGKYAKTVVTFTSGIPEHCSLRHCESFSFLVVRQLQLGRSLNIKSYTFYP
jgi:hypothetical protein